MSALSPEPDVSRLRDSLHNLMACRSALLTGPALQELSHVIKTRRRPQDVLEDTANRVRNDDGSLPDNWDSQQILRNSDDELQTAEDDIRNARAEVQGRLDAFWAAESEVRGAIDALDEETANALCEHYHAGWLTRLTRSIDTIIEPIRFSALRNGHPADVSVVLTALWHNQTLLPQEEPPLSELMQDLASLRFAPQQPTRPEDTERPVGKAATSSLIHSSADEPPAKYRRDGMQDGDPCGPVCGTKTALGFALHNDDDKTPQRYRGHFWEKVESETVWVQNPKSGKELKMFVIGFPNRNRCQSRVNLFAKKRSTKPNETERNQTKPD